jgi:predicted enzyme related to lactoylglutathione lyase
MATLYRGIGKVRAHGKARIAITIEARDETDFLRRWHKPANEYPFEWENGHRFCIEYQVDDFAAEVGFYVDVLGITVDSISPSRAQFSSPDQELVLAVSAVDPEQPSIPPQNLLLQMFIKNLETTVTELEKRGVIFELPPQPSNSDPELLVARFQTPNGMFVELWGYQIPASRSRNSAYPPQAEAHDDNGDDDEAYDEQDTGEDEDEVSPDPLPLFSLRPITIDELDNELEEDGDDLSDPTDNSREHPYVIDEDQLELEIGFSENEQEENEALDPDEAEDERLERFLKASSRPAGYTFDERIEPIVSPKSSKPPSALPERKLAPRRRSGRSQARSQIPENPIRKQQPQRPQRQPEPPVIEPTYDDIDEQDQIP